MKRWIHESDDVDSVWTAYDPYAAGTYRVTGGLETKNFNNPAKAIEAWFRFQEKNPADCMIMCRTKDEAVVLCSAATEELLTDLYNRYKCPYKLQYLIDSAAREVQKGQPYFHEGEFGDTVHPFGVG